MSLTIYFNGQYWCALVEYLDEYDCWVVREYIFGSEPKSEEIFTFIKNILPYLINEPWLAKNQQLKLKQSNQKKKNPKRLQRMITKEKTKKEISSKSQEAIRLQQEEKRTLTLKRKKALKRMEQQVKFEKRQTKKREKHKGH